MIITTIITPSTTAELSADSWSRDLKQTKKCGSIWETAAGAEGGLWGVRGHRGHGRCGGPGLWCLLVAVGRVSVPWVPPLTLTVSPLCVSRASQAQELSPALFGGSQTLARAQERVPLVGTSWQRVPMILMEPPRPLLTGILRLPKLPHQRQHTAGGRMGLGGHQGHRGRGTKGQRTWSSTRGGQGWSPRLPLLIPSRLQDESGLGPKALLAPS